MTDKEAMKLALFALDIVKIHYTQSRHVNEAITALKERFADPMREVQRLGQEIEQEPVAWKLLGSAHFRKTLPKNTDVTNWSPLYSAPQRSWVGLSEKKQWEIARNISCFDWGELMSETEQALKELNT
jgi:hypothetical protein